jgi:polyphosphate glucokinase
MVAPMPKAGSRTKRSKSTATPPGHSTGGTATPPEQSAPPPVAGAARPGVVEHTGPSLSTLSFDIGGTGLKASVLASHGELLHEPVRVPTPYPLRPEQLVDALAQLAQGLPEFQRISAGFPGMVRTGQIISAPHFVSPDGPGGKPTAELEKAWDHFDLQGALASKLGRPCRVANDADVQGAALVSGKGLELVVTLGTGVGTALFWHGKLAPHLELAHHPLWKDGSSYNEVLGDQARRRLGHKKWNSRVERTIDVLRNLMFFDHCYIGGGNSRHVSFKLPADVSLADNTAGILGGIRLWQRT